MKSVYYILFLLLFLHIILHWNIFTKDLGGRHLWRQAQTQLNIQNFYRHDFNILNPRNNTLNGNGNILRMEFPIMQWTVASFYKLFGEDILITRLCMFIFSFSGILAFFLFIREIFGNELVALLSTIAFSFTPDLFYYMMNPLPDIFALAMSIWFLFFYYKYINTESKYYLVLSGLFISLSILAKLPFIMIGVIPCVHFIQLYLYRKDNNKQHLFNIIIVFFCALVPPIAWYGWVISDWGTTTIVGGIINNPLTIDKFISISKYHLGVIWPKLLIGFSALPLFLFGTYCIFKKRAFNHTKAFPWIAYSLTILAYFLYEFTLIDTIHDYYMFPFIIIFYLIISYGIHCFLINKHSFIYLLMFAMPINAYFTTQDFWTKDKYYVDPYLLSDRILLRSLVPSHEKCIMLNDQSNNIMPYLVDKHGYVFANDILPILWIDDMIKNHQVKYMYSTSRKVDGRTDVQFYLDSLLYQKGDLKVFRLKLKY